MTTVRLAVGITDPARTVKAFGGFMPSEDSPTVRMAVNDRTMDRTVRAFPPRAPQGEAPNVRFALGSNVNHAITGTQARGPAAADSPTMRMALVTSERTVMGLAPDQGEEPAVLVSYFYLSGFLKHRHRMGFRDWVMDSGAYSAANSGVTIDLQEYIDTCARLLEEDPKLTEVFGLDVIGDPEASLRNCEEMVRQGIPVIPTMHIGEPWEVVQEVKRYPKFAVGGMVGLHKARKIKFIEQVFARAWPHKIHAFGIASEEILMRFPFHSADASNWETAPCAFGNWKVYGKMSVRGGTHQHLRAEIEWYMALERKLRFRWRKEMARLDALDKEREAARGT